MKNSFTKAITDRFREAMLDVIRKNKLSGGKINSAKAFALSIGQSPQNFSNMVSARRQHVSMDIAAHACRKYNISPNYLLLGIGEMYLSKDVAGKADKLEDRVKRLEKLLLDGETKSRLKKRA